MSSRNISFVSIFKIKLKQSLLRQATPNTEVAKKTCLWRNCRSKYDFGEKFGFKVNKVINSTYIKVHRVTRIRGGKSDFTLSAEKQSWKFI